MTGQVYKECARFQFRAAGGLADDGQMPITALADILESVGNILRLSTLLALDRPNPGPRDLKAVQVRVLPPEYGSFSLTLAVWVAEGIVVASAGAVAKGAIGETLRNVGSGVREGLSGPPDADREKMLGRLIGEAIKRISSSLFGKTEDAIDRSLEHELPWFNKVEDVSEEVEPSFRKAADVLPSEGTLENSTASTIELIGPSLRLAKPHLLFVLDAAAKVELGFELVSEKPYWIKGRVRQLNERSGKGILVVDRGYPEVLGPGRDSVRFWPADGREQHDVERLAENLSENVGLSMADAQFVPVLVRKVTTGTGRTKRVLVDRVG